MTFPGRTLEDPSGPIALERSGRVAPNPLFGIVREDAVKRPLRPREAPQDSAGDDAR